MAIDSAGTCSTHVPAVGGSSRVVVGCVVGIAFILFGIVCDVMMVSMPEFMDAPFWLFHMLFGGSAVIGIVTVGYCGIEMLRSFDFHVSADGLHRTVKCGPFRQEQYWPWRDISGISPRVDTRLSATGTLSTLMLVLIDGRSVSLLPARETPVVHWCYMELSKSLRISPDRNSVDAPLGGGLEVSDGTDRLRITASPISPNLVPGSIYAIATLVSVSSPVFTLLIVIAMWPMIRHSELEIVAWPIIIGQTVVMTFGGYLVRNWVARIASKRYEIAIDSLGLTVISESGGDIRTFRCSIDDVREIRCRAIVAAADEGRPIIERIELVAGAASPIELLCGRPPEETKWVLSSLRRRWMLAQSVAPPDSLV